LRMDKIAELQRIANKEHRGVVAGHVPVAFFGVKLQRKSAWVALRIRGAFLAADRRESDKGGRFLAYRVKELCRRVLGDFAAGANEMPVCARTLGVNHPLRDALPVKVRHLFKKQKVFKHYRSARSDREGVLIVAHRTP